MTEQLPDIFGAAPELSIPSSGLYPPRLLVSHGKEDGVLAKAWEKYGKLEQGDLVIQDGDDFFLCHPKDYWFLLPSTALVFAGVRDAWTKELTSASFDLSNCEKGGNMHKQVSAAAIFLKSHEVPGRDAIPEIIGCQISAEKARAAGPLALIRELERYSKIESKTPAAFRVYAHFFGKVTKTRPNAQGKTFFYSGIEARTKQTPDAVLERLGKLLPEVEGHLHLAKSKIEEEREKIRKIENCEDLPNGPVRSE